MLQFHHSQSMRDSRSFPWSQECLWHMTELRVLSSWCIGQQRQFMAVPSYTETTLVRHTSLLVPLRLTKSMVIYSVTKPQWIKWIYVQYARLLSRIIHMKFTGEDNVPHHFNIKERSHQWYRACWTEIWLNTNKSICGYLLFFMWHSGNKYSYKYIEAWTRWLPFGTQYKCIILDDFLFLNLD